MLNRAWVLTVFDVWLPVWACLERSRRCGGVIQT